MHDHREILELAATAVDFDLDPANRERLAAALETCSLCRRQVAAMRATATVLSRPLDIGTPSRVRDVVVGAAMGRTRPAPSWRSMLAAGLSIVVVLGGTAVVVGTRGLGILPAASPVASLPTETAALGSPVPSSTSSAEASPVPTPSASTAPSPAQAGLRAGDVAAMVTDGRLVIRTLPETGANSAIFKTRLYPGQRVLVLEGPVEGDGYQWYRVRLGDIEGWAAAADRTGDPWLTRVDNGVIAFVHDDSDGSTESIHTIGPDGASGEAELFSDPALAHYEELAWSPDGRRLAFVSVFAEPIDAQSEIFVIDADGSNLVRVTNDDLYSSSPAWSPDGSHLAFRQTSVDPISGSLVASEVAVVNADGTGLRVLGPGENPVWSPDGQLIAMTVTSDGRGSLWVQSPDGAGRRQVGDLEVASVAPAWSPDGLSLLVSDDGLSIVDVASGSARALLPDPRGSASPATWSIDGTIAFSAVGSGAPTYWVIDPDGTDRRQVLANVGGGAIATWSPDDRWLLVYDEHTGTTVTLVEPDRGTVVEVANVNGLARSAAWQPVIR